MRTKFLVGDTVITKEAKSLNLTKGSRGKVVSISPKKYYFWVKLFNTKDIWWIDKDHLYYCSEDCSNCRERFICWTT